MDPEAKRLEEDVEMDKFKLVEKFLLYWLPREKDSKNGVSAD